VLLHYLAKRENTKIAFSLKCCIGLGLFNHSLLDFFNLFGSQLILTLLTYDSLNLVINEFSLGLLWGTVEEKGSRERCSSWTVLHIGPTMRQCAVFWVFTARRNTRIASAVPATAIPSV